MKTVLTKKINNYNIVIGYSNPVIDPIETFKSIDKLSKKEKSKVKRKILIKENAIYFTPKKGEYIISDNDCNNLIETEIEKYHKLSIKIVNNKVEIKTISDYSKYVIWKKTDNRWNQINVAINNNLPVGSIIDINLTEEQKNEIIEQTEIDRISVLSQSEKDIEKQKKIILLSYEAVNMRSVLEIQDDPEPLQKSKAWYNEQVAIIETKYN